VFGEEGAGALSQLELGLFPPQWWTKEDDSALATYFQFQAKMDAIPVCDNLDDIEGCNRTCEAYDAIPCLFECWTCRRCKNWESRDGLLGKCVPGFAIFTETHKNMQCEEWDPLIPEISQLKLA
jgi:hypothetical protein